MNGNKNVNETNHLKIQSNFSENYITKPNSNLTFNHHVTCNVMIFLNENSLCFNLTNKPEEISMSKCHSCLACICIVLVDIAE